MRNAIIFFILICITQWTNAQSSNCGQSNLSPFCSGIAQYPANFDGTGAGSGPQAPVGPNYDCLGTQGNPTFFSLTIESTGSIDFTLTNTANVDIDFILWGPFSNMNSAIQACDSMGTGGVFGDVADCSYSVVSQEQVTIPNAIQGEVYILMVTNFANVATNIFSTQNIGSGSVACPCDIPFRADTLPTAFGNQGYIVDTLNGLNTYLVCPNNTLGIFLGSSGKPNDTLSLFGPFTNINNYFSNYSIFQTYPLAPQQDSIEIYALITPDLSNIGVNDITLGLKNDIYTGGFSDSSCFDQAFFRVIVPGVQLNDRQVCSGESFQVEADSIPSTSLGSSNYNWYQISGPSAVINGPTSRNPTIVIPTLASTSPGDSIQIVVDYQYGALCSMSDTMTLFFNDIDLIMSATPDTVCVGQTTTLGAVLSDTLAPSQCDAYIVSNIPFSPISGSGTSVSLSDDAVTSSLPIGFNFNFYCNDYTSFVISSNGFISFDLSAPNGCCNGQIIPDPFTPNDLIALCWTDCNPSAGGTINYFTTGTAPNRQLIINFINVPPYSSNSGNQTVQAILYESSNTIDIHVTNATPSGIFSTLTIGIENATGTNGHVPPTTNATTNTISNTSFRFEQVNSLPTYTWTPSLGLNDPNIQNPNATINANTIFQALVTDGVCAYSDSIQIVTQAGLATPTVTCDSATVSSLSFSWSDIGLPPTGYYEYSLDGGTTWINAGLTLSATVTSLLSNTLYTILVRANDGTGSACPLSNAGSANCTTLNADCTSNPPLNITLQGINNRCFGDSTGCILSTITGGSGNPLQLNWSNGLTDLDSICNLTAGSYTLIATDTFSLNSGGTTQNLIYAENFDGTHNWTLNVPTGTNGSDNNFWEVDSDEAGMPVGACGTSGGTNRSLHITSVFNPFGGAAYDAGGLCPILFCPETNMRAESPPFSTVGFTNLDLSFHFIANGSGLTDNASVWYNDGSGWSQLTASIKSPTCGSGQGLWTLYGATLPVSCENNPAVRIGINWTNNDDGIGTDPSVAIDSIQVISSTTNSNLISCVDSANITLVEPSLIVSVIDSFSNPSCIGSSDGTIYASSSGGTPGYTYQWSSTDTSAIILSATDGLYTVTVTDINGCTDSTSVTLTSAEAVNVIIDSISILLDCDGVPTGSLQAIPSGGLSFTYQWSNGDTTALINNLAEGIYTVIVTNQNGCSDSVSTQIVAPLFPNLNAYINTVGLQSDAISLGDNASLFSGVSDTSNTSFLWTYTGPDNANIDDSTQNNTFVSPDSDGEYVFVIEASLSSEGLICFDYDTLYLTVETPYKGIPDAFTPNGDGLNDLFRPVNLDASSIMIFRIYNRFGQEVYNGDELPNGGWDGTLGGIPQPTEVYIYVLTFQRQSDATATTIRGQVSLIR